MLVFEANSAEITFTTNEKAWIKNHPQLICGVNGEYPPYEFSKNNKLQGILFDYISYFEKATGIKCKWQIGNPLTSKNDNALFAKKIDFLANMAITEKRKEKFLFTLPFASEPLVIMSRTNDKYISNLSDLNGKKIALPNGFYTLEIIKRDYPGIEIVKYKNVEECLLALSSGKVDAVVDVLGVLAYYVNIRGYTNLRIVAPTEYRNIELAMCTTKDNLVLNGIFNKVILSISDADHGKIRHKWISSRYDAKTQEIIPPYLKWGALILGILFVLFLARNLILRKHIRLQIESEVKLRDSLEQITKQSNERKLLLKEIHHRVKNNLQFVASLIKLQAAENNQLGNEFDVDRSIDRIQAIGLIHEKIYKTNFETKINCKEYFRSLIETILVNYSSNKKIELQLEIDEFNPKSDVMVPLAIIMNELVVNSLKHGFSNKESGLISLSMKINAGELMIDYTDNGAWQHAIDSDGFGTDLVHLLTEQLNGKMNLLQEPTTRYHFLFTLNELANPN